LRRSADANEQSVIASELAQNGQHALAFALWPSETNRARVEVAEHFSLKDEVERCHQLFGAGQFRESAEAYAQLFAARPDLVRVLFNIAQSLRRAGESRPALAFYRRYLDADPQTPLRAEVDGYIRELSALVSAKAQLGQKPSASPPLYKRAWFWVTLTGGVALVVTTAVILGVTLNTPVTPPPPEEVLGPFDVVFPRVN
jgi:tetratricopeptide (TPR) repeat protein